MPASRHLGRVLALQTLFAYEFHGGDPEKLLSYIGAEFDEKKCDVPFAKKLVYGVLEHVKIIRERIVPHAPAWPMDKIAPADRGILEIAVYEMLYCPDVPQVVAIDEAIELAKSFGSDNSPKFINGVLNALLEEQKSSLA